MESNREDPWGNKMAALKKDWYKPLAKESEDLDKIRQKPGRKLLSPVPDVAEMIPPFRGLSRQLLTIPDAAVRLDISVTTLRLRIKERLIFTHPRGRFIYIPIEECENYSERERLRGMERHA